MSLTAYEQAAIHRAVNKIDSRIKNSSIEHANILIKTMIDYAGEGDVLYIYSGCLPKDTFASLNHTKASKIKVIVDDDSSIGWLANSLQKDRLSVWKISRKRDHHFLCTTGGFFRFETNPENYEAEANFYEPPVVDTLVQAFDRYAKNATPVIV